MSRNSEKPTVTVNKFPGLSTVDDPVEVGNSGLVTALNVDITRQNKVKRRKGATSALALGSGTVDAAWGNNDHLLLLQGDTLVAVDETFNPTALRSGLTQTGMLCANDATPDVIYSNGVETGKVIDNTSVELGVQPPPKVVANEIPAKVGQMTAGRYQVACTYVRSDGFESGASIATIVDLSQDLSGITLTHTASTNAGVVAINIYCSRPNGSTLYFAMQTDNTTGNTSYTAHANFLQRALRNQFKVPPPAFDVVAMGRNNRMMYAKGNLVFMSDPYAPEHVDLEITYQLPAPVTIIAVLEGGVFVCTDKLTYYIKGDTLEKAEMDIVAPYGAVIGTRTHIDGALLGDGSISDILPAWMSHKGLCVGMPDGSVNNLTQSDVTIPKGLKGTAMFRQEDGQNHIISVIQK